MNHQHLPKHVKGSPIKAAGYINGDADTESFKSKFQSTFVNLDPERISGTDTSYPAQQLAFLFAKGITQGEHKVGSGEGQVICYYYRQSLNGGGYYHYAESGTIDIKSYNEQTSQAEGDFDVKAKNSDPDISGNLWTVKGKFDMRNLPDGE